MSFVQGNSGVQPTGTTVDVAFTGAVAAGHCLLGFMRLATGSDVAGTPSDTVNGNWTRIGRIVHTSTSISSLVFKFPSSGAGTPIVTFPVTGTQSYRVGIAEYSEADVDAITSGNLISSSNNPVSGTVTAKAGATVVGYVGVDTGTTTYTGAGSPTATSRLDVTAASPAASVADLLATLAGGYTVSWSLGSSKVSAAFAIAMLPKTNLVPAISYYNSQLQRR